MDKKIKVALISGDYVDNVFGCKHLVHRLKDKSEMADLLDEVRNALDETESGEVLKVKITSMTQTEIDKVPESD